MPAGNSNPGLGYATFCAIKFAGYTAAAHFLSMSYNRDDLASWKVGGVRTLIGMAAGAAYYGLWTLIPRMTHPIAAGHQVTGLVRSPEKAEAVRARGIQPVLGTLDDSETLARAARAADVVVNAASADHKGAVVGLLDALGGTGKPFIHTSGSS